MSGNGCCRSDGPEVLRLRPLSGSESEICGIHRAIEGSEVHHAQFPPPDPSSVGDFISSRLLRDAARLSLRSGAGPFRSQGRLSVRPRPYRFVPLIMAFRLDPVRMLIADDVGVGKTIEAALIAKELLDQGGRAKVMRALPTAFVRPSLPALISSRTSGAATSSSRIARTF